MGKLDSRWYEVNERYITSNDGIKFDMHITSLSPNSIEIIFHKVQILFIEYNSFVINIFRC